MVEWYLVSNTDNEVTYRMVTGDTHKTIGNMTVNKETKAYKLDYAEEMTIHYESMTYDFILGAIERNIYPDYSYDGWC